MQYILEYLCKNVLSHHVKKRPVWLGLVIKIALSTGVLDSIIAKGSPISVVRTKHVNLIIFFINTTGKGKVLKLIGIL